MHTNDFFKRNTEWNGTKHGMNVPYEVLTKCCYFVADPSSKIAASGGDLVKQRTLWEMHTTVFLQRTTEWKETKDGMNVPY